MNLSAASFSCTKINSKKKFRAEHGGVLKTCKYPFLFVISTYSHSSKEAAGYQQGTYYHQPLNFRRDFYGYGIH